MVVPDIIMKRERERESISGQYRQHLAKKSKRDRE